MKLRFMNQVYLLDNDLPLSNILHTKKLTEIELTVLKKTLALIPSFQNKINTDFRIAT